MKPLFGYGTFRHTAWREKILGAAYRAQPATLAGYRRVATASGYLTLRETVVPVGLIEGMLIDLDAIGWQIADAWEEVPTYRRADVVVNTMSGPVDATAYVCDADGTPVEDDCLALLDDIDVNAAIARFAKTMRAIRGEA